MTCDVFINNTPSPLIAVAENQFRLPDDSDVCHNVALVKFFSLIAMPMCPACERAANWKHFPPPSASILDAYAGNHPLSLDPVL